MINFLILSGAAITAYLIERLYGFIDKQFALRAYYNGKFYQKKVKRLHDNAFYYYYDLMQQDPVRLSYELASRDINRLKRERKIDFMYAKYKLKG